MAIAVTGLAGSSSITDATSYDTASITPPSNSLILATIESRHATVQPNTPTITGCGLTWVLVESEYDAAVTILRKISTFRALGASPSAGALTIDFAGQTQNHCIWSVAEFSGVDTSGTNGSGAIVQSIGESKGSSTTSQTITLAAFGSSNNFAYGVFLHFANEATAPGTGFTEIHDVALAENITGFETEYKANDTTVDASWATSGISQGIAIEIKAAGGSSGPFYFSTSGNDTTGDGTIALPWQNFKGKKNGNGALSAGDVCYFNRGDVWTGSNAEVVVNSNGTAASPIILDSYGSGNEPVFAGAAVTSAGWTDTGANSIWTLASQSQTHLRTVTQGTTKALGLWRGTVTTLPTGTFKRSGTTLYVRCWGDVDPSSADVRVASFAHSSSVDGVRGLVSSSRSSSYGDHVHFKNLKVLGANGIGFSASGLSNQFFDCIAIGCGREGIAFYSELAGSGENADGGRWWRGEVAYCAASGTGNGQGCTTYAPRCWWISASVHDNFMAGIDFLNASATNHNAIECGAAWNILYDNGRWQDASVSYDPNIYVDGAAYIFIYGNVCSGSGTVTGATAARASISFGSENLPGNITRDVYIINNLVYRNHYIGIGGNNLDASYDNIKNIYIINNTVVSYLAGTFDMCWYARDFDTTANNWVMRNNLFVAKSGSSRVNLYTASSSYLDSDYNLVWRTDNATPIYTSSGTDYTLATWRTLSGEDASSVNSDPLLINLTEVDATIDVHLSQIASGQGSDSPALNIGVASPFTVPSWVPSDVFTYGATVRGTTRSDGVFDDTTTSIDAGYHYASDEADPGGGGGSTFKGMLLLGVG